MFSAERPFFSVILCTYERARLLPRALESLLAQEETDWEAVIVDDGSTDATPEVARGYAARCSALRYLRQEHAGLVAARNRGAGAARGRWLTFLDADDAYRPEHLRRRREALARDPEAEFLHGGYVVIGDPTVPDRADPARRIHLDACAVGGTFVLRAETFRRLGGFPDAPYSPDGALFETAQARGVRIVRVEDPTYVYDRTQPDSLCNTLPPRRLR